MTPAIQKITATSKEEFYKELVEQVIAIQDQSLAIVSNLSNLSSLLFYAFNDNSSRINWAGFYIFDGEQELMLGPFQGRIACTRIKMGKGVCGLAAQQKKTIRVDNVHEFKGHIACDSETESEIVVPIVVDGVLFGVLDVDSLSLAQFDSKDEKGLESVVAAIVQHLQLYNDKTIFTLQK
jgi:L-methionine (R)-S-oxide reductase